jgi:predicted transglutaminase-like cysteine proteinase
MQLASVTIWGGLVLGALMPLKAGADPVKTASLNPTAAQDRASPYLRVFGVTQAPYGFVAFCNRDPKSCADGPPEEIRKAGNADHLAELDRVNRKVNREIEPVSDQDLYGVTEFWTIPRSAKGDCEDYALSKRQLLIQSGWPPSALLMTVVLDEKNEGHAVLTVRTGSGDYVLDNKVDELKIWHKTPYKFVMRQSYLNARLWMSLDPKEAMPSVAIAGMKQTKGIH